MEKCNRRGTLLRVYLLLQRNLIYTGIRQRAEKSVGYVPATTVRKRRYFRAPPQPET